MLELKFQIKKKYLMSFKLFVGVRDTRVSILYRESLVEFWKKKQDFFSHSKIIGEKSRGCVGGRSLTKRSSDGIKTFSLPKIYF